jgi:hypothetical protein
MWDLIALIGDLFFPFSSSSDERRLPEWVAWTLLSLLAVAVCVLIWSLVRS